MNDRKFMSNDHPPKKTGVFIAVKPIALHALCWVIYIAYELIVAYAYQLKMDTLFHYILYYAMNIGLFYAHTAILDYTFNARKTRLTIGIMLFMIVQSVFIILKFLSDHFFGQPPFLFSGDLTRFLRPLLLFFFRGIYFSILATFIWLTRYSESLKRQFAAVQNAYYRQQINPHLLLNSLNFIYADIRKHSVQSAEAVLNLSDIMRFTLENTAPDDMIRPEAEWQQVLNLIAINRRRFGNALHLEAGFTNEGSGAVIIPLLLMTVAENLFKHGVLTDVNNPALLHVAINESDVLKLHTTNFRRTSNRAAPGIGLENLKLRLDYTYKGDYKLDINETGQYFTLKLMIKLKG